MERVILHVDMNNFYASVECMLDPSLRGKPVAVCGSTEERHGIVLAKNYEAKAYGVQTAEAIWQAKQKCRDLLIVPPHYDQYMKFSKKARKIYERFTDKIEPYGMDECWLDVTGCYLGSGPEIADIIRRTIKFELGLTVSVGVSFNKVFAKLGSDMKKPDAVTVIEKRTFREKIWGLPAEELLGVGRATNKKLKKFGIHTIGDLAATSEEFMQREFGKHGIQILQFARGNDISEVMPNDYVSPVKSIGHGITTVEDLVNSAEVWNVMLSLVQDIGSKLRLHKKRAGGVSIFIRDNELFSKEWQCKFDLPTRSSTYIAREAFDLFCRSYSWQRPIRSVTVRAIYLVEEDAPVQTSVFDNSAKLEKREKLDSIIETLRKRFGKNVITYATLCQNLKLPPDRETELIMPTGMFG